MMNSETSQLSNGLVYEDLLPLSWAVMYKGTQEVNHSRITEHNEHVLRCVNLLSDQANERIDEESEVESAIVRLEAKVNLILEMLSKLAGERDAALNSIQIRVSAGGIEWACGDRQPKEGDDVWIYLHIDNRVPEAIQLAARVVSVTDADSGAVAYAKFEDMGEVVQDQLEKLIFRHHRRMVAQSKSK
jgi:hypothetical protein